MNVTLEGGSGRATVESPAALTVADGKMTAILWSSPNYDYMIVDGEKYLPTNTEGNSTFESLFLHWAPRWLSLPIP